MTGFGDLTAEPGAQKPALVKFVSSDASEDSIDNCLGVLVTEGRRPQ